MLIKGSIHAVLASGTIDMSDALIAFHPLIEEPSNEDQNDSLRSCQMSKLDVATP